MTAPIPTAAPPPLPRRRGLKHLLACAVAAGAAVLAWQTAGSSAGHAKDSVALPVPAKDEPAGAGREEKAVFAGGCFWGVQGVYQHVRGVTRAVSGYAGGAADTAHYELVGSGRTGHAESVEVTFDPTQVSYGTLLQIFFSVAHDPTEVDRQGPDDGPQYRSAVFPATASQREVAQAYIAQLNGSRLFAAPIATRIEDGARFYPAEDYHQDFLVRHPSYPYIVINDLPKIAEFKRLFPTQYREDPVLLNKAS